MSHFMGAHALLENASSYSIVLNLLGIEERNIGVTLDGPRRELSVLAKKESPSCKRGFYWVFGIPDEACMDTVRTRYRSGVLEIVIGKSYDKAA